jgi:uncharacterized protein YwgA
MNMEISLPKKLKFVLFFLNEAKEVKGKTKFQKMFFLLNEEEKISTGHSFVKYTYGPYSSELSNDLDALKQLELIQVEQSMFETNSNFVGKQFEYKLTTSGEQLINQQLTDFTGEEKQKVKKIILEWNNKELPEIIDYVYGKYMPRK